jgi:hypothetical protein
MREHPAVAISLQLMCFLGPLGVCDGQEVINKPNRIKKLFMKEISAVLLGNCVLFLVTTSNPQVYCCPII